MRCRIVIAVVCGLLLSENGWSSQGERLFNDTCAACHQKGAVGAPGLAPPLRNAALWARLGSRSASYIVGVMLFGMSGTLDGPETSLIMPPQDQLSDTQLAAIATYVLKELNGMNSAIDAKWVAAKRASPVSHGELRELRQ